VIVDGAPGLEAALVALWGDDLPIQRCTVHKHRNLLAHAPKHMHEELGNDYRDMIYADTAAEVETRRKALSRANGGAPMRCHWCRWPVTYGEVGGIVSHRMV